MELSGPILRRDLGDLEPAAEQMGTSGAEGASTQSLGYVSFPPIAAACAVTPP
jgi:hypothetical protein